MFIVEVEITGKHDTKTFQDDTKVIGFYMDMCKAKLAQPGFSFNIDKIVHYCDCSLKEYKIACTNSGISLIEADKIIIQGGGAPAEGDNPLED